VILSQLWRGFARSLDSKPKFGADDLAHAMREASETAYKGVLKPVEGTILTVSRAVAEATEIARREDDESLLHSGSRRYIRQRNSGQHTQLVTGAQAGRCGRFGWTGVTVILEGMLRYLRGESLDAPRDRRWKPRLISERRVPADRRYRRRVMSHKLQLRRAMHHQRPRHGRGCCPAKNWRDGVSTLVVGDAETIKVHVHVPPSPAPRCWPIAETVGRLHDVVVEDMAAQYQQYLLGRFGAAHPVVNVQHRTGNIATLAVVPAMD